jgi:hypothetical protein
MRMRHIFALLSVALLCSAGVMTPSAAYAADDTGDTGSSSDVELQEWKSDDGCSVLAAPAAVLPALLALVVVGRRRRQDD